VKTTTKLHTLAFATLLLLPCASFADEKPALIDALSEYMDFSDYSSSLILPEQIPTEEWKNVVVIDARDAGQFEREHIPGAINIEWRQTVVRRNEIPKNKLVVVYCNTGTLSAQSVFVLRLLGWDNVKVLQGGIEGWKAKGGFEASQRATSRQPARE
jgi:rhodanese-related sulfurtransferase